MHEISHTALPDQAADLANLPLAELRSRLEVTLEGLSTSEAQTRLEQHGHNEIPGERANPVLRFLSYF